jgi:hypothetical protein
MLTEPTLQQWWSIIVEDSIVFHSKTDLAARHLVESSLGGFTLSFVLH